jgi:hypothetical protein
MLSRIWYRGFSVSQIFSWEMAFEAFLLLRYGNEGFKLICILQSSILSIRKKFSLVFVDGFCRRGRILMVRGGYAPLGVARQWDVTTDPTFFFPYFFLTVIVFKTMHFI